MAVTIETVARPLSVGAPGAAECNGSYRADGMGPLETTVQAALAGLPACALEQRVSQLEAQVAQLLARLDGQSCAPAPPELTIERIDNGAVNLIGTHFSPNGKVTIRIEAYSGDHSALSLQADGEGNFRALFRDPLVNVGSSVLVDAADEARADRQAWNGTMCTGKQTM
ncbi:MAG TPA: hypothetical protein DCW29_01340 [Janthinobacterium sp.]|nr:hypothetical protein [Janthinobacterium sp.]